MFNMTNARHTIAQVHALATAGGWKIHPMRAMTEGRAQQAFSRGNIGIVVFYTDAGIAKPLATTHTIGTSGRTLVRDLAAALAA